MKKIIFSIIYCFFTLNIFAQINCANAIALTPGTQQCGNSTGNMGDFPADGSAPTNPCSINHNDDEYWFTYAPGPEVDNLELTLSSISTFFTGFFVLDACPSNAPSCIASDVNLVSTDDIVISFPVVSGTTYKIVIATFGPPDGSSFCLDAVETLCLLPTVSIPSSPVDLSNCPNTIDFTISIDDLMDSNSLLISTNDGTGNPAGVGGTTNSTGNFIITNVPVPQSNWSIKIAHENNTACDVILGPFELSCPPSNDILCNAIEIVVNADFVVGTNEFAVSENLEPEGSCWVGNGDLNSVWYSFVAPNSQAVTVSTDYANTPLHDSHIAVYAVGNCTNMNSLIEIGCNEDGGTEGPDGDAAEIEVYQLTPNETYYIQVDGKENEVGEFHISVKEITPSNDNCSASTFITGGAGTAILLDQFFAGATDSGYGTSTCDNNSTPAPLDLWYRIPVQPGSMSVQVDPGSNSDIVLSIYNGCFPQLFQYCVDLGGNGGQESISFNATVNNIYVRVYEKSYSGESFDISAILPVLPIELSTFEAKSEKRGNIVKWSTLSEINSDYVDVQRSPNGANKWESLGKVQSKGESTSQLDYELFDYNPYEVTYYRLNAVDKDGKAELSRVINVRRSDVVSKMTLSPNPTSSKISLQTVSDFDKEANIVIMDITGQIMKKQNASLKSGLNTISIDLNDLAAGVYVFSLQTRDNVQVEKIVKQ